MFSGTSEPSRAITASVVVLATVATAAALAYTRPVMVPFVLAVFLSYLVRPIVNFLQDRLKIPRFVSILIALLLAVGLLTLLALLIITSTRGLMASADIYRDRLEAIAARVFSVLDRFGTDLGQGTFLEGIGQLPVLTLVQNAAGTVMDIITNGGLVVIFLIYLVAGRRPDEQRVGIYAEIHAKIQKYIVTKFIISATTGLLVGIILSLIGLDLALVFGVMAFLLNFIPSIGSVISTLLPIPIAIIQFDSVWAITAIVALPGVVQMVIGNGIEPLVMGESLDLHPITVILSLIFWGLLWGIVGMFLATPIMAVLRIVLARIDETKPIAELLAGRLPRATPRAA
jgi:AI-2 transport protein TqsA